MTLVILLRQLLPFDGQRATRRLVLFFPVCHQIETGVIDVRQILDVNENVRPRWQGLQFPRQFRQADQRRRTVEVKVDEPKVGKGATQMIALKRRGEA